MKIYLGYIFCHELVDENQGWRWGFKTSLFVVSKTQTLGALCDLHVGFLGGTVAPQMLFVFLPFCGRWLIWPLGSIFQKVTQKISVNYWSFGEISVSNEAKLETLVNEDPLHNPRLFFRNCRNVTLLGRSSVPQGQLRFQGGGRFWWFEAEGCGVLLGNSEKKRACLVEVYHGIFKNSNAKGDSKIICFFSLHNHGWWWGIGDLSANWPKR